MKSITVTIQSDEDMILKVERFLALLHFSSAWGHTCTAAMDIDGDGSNRLTVTGIDLDAHRTYVDKVARRPKTKSVDYVSAAPLESNLTPRAADGAEPWACKCDWVNDANNIQCVACGAPRR
jgi:hypothetical protein